MQLTGKVSCARDLLWSSVELSSSCDTVDNENFAVVVNKSRPQLEAYASQAFLLVSWSPFRAF